MNHPDEYKANPEQFRGSTTRNNVVTFAKFVLKQYREDEHGVNDHFSLLRIHGGIHYADDLVRGWNVWNLEDKATWDWIYRRQIGGNHSLLQNWFDVREEKHLDPLKPDEKVKTAVHGSGTESKMLQHYDSDEVLYHALKYVWRDYHTFNIKLPKWICGVVRDRVKAFLRVYFVHKRYLLPECILE